MNNLSIEEVQQLLNQIAKENDKAFDSLLKAYQADFVRLVSRWRWVHNMHDAEEIVQEAFLSIWRKPQGFNGKCKFSTFFYTIVKRKYLDWLKKQPVEEVEWNDKEALEWPSLEDSPEVVLEKKEMNDVLRECVNKLSDVQREAVEMAYFQQELQSVIANVLNVPVGTVKTRVKYGIANLAKCVQGLIRQGV